MHSVLFENLVFTLFSDCVHFPGHIVWNGVYVVLNNWPTAIIMVRLLWTPCHIHSHSHMKICTPVYVTESAKTGLVVQDRKFDFFTQTQS